MKKSTYKESQIAGDFLEQSIPIRGTFIRTVTRANGEIDRKVLPNVVMADGLKSTRLS